MDNIIGYTIAGLLVLSAVLLGLLIPGGPIENRNFSHIAPTILGIFNTFLTVLGIASLPLAYFSIGAGNIALIASAVCGISYFLVYALDLTTIFPVSPDKMPRALFIIEVLGFIIAIPLTFFSLYYLTLPRAGITEMDLSSSTINSIFVVVLIIGIGVIIFATKAAMRK